MLEIKNLNVAIGEKKILNDISLQLEPGKLHVFLGPNGSGKSSLLAAIMGLPPFSIISGEILLDGQLINDLSISERARLGIGLAYQRPPSMDGVSIAGFAEALGATELLEREAKTLDLEKFFDRDLNVGFSGGEIKRWEILKLFLQDSSLLLFDEPESGVDLEHVIAVGESIRRLVETPDSSGKKRAGLVITHTGLILNYVDADMAHVIKAGRIAYSGDPKELFEYIKSNGYSQPSAAA